MKLPFPAPSVGLVVIMLGAAIGLSQAASADGFVDIFNGKDLSGWVAEGKKEYKDGDQTRPIWTVEDGMIVCAGNGYGFLRYDTKLGDSIIHVEYRMTKGCNSGLGIRGVEFTGGSKTRPSFAGYEMQVLDDAGREPSKHSSGSLYRYVAPKVNATKPAPQWNTVEIECRGPRIRITMNGQVIHDLDQTTIDQIKDKPVEGYFSLQNHGKRIEFRNLRVKKL